MNSKIIEKTINFCVENFADKKNYILPEEFNYSHLPLCVIDSVFSIGVRYEIVQNTINNFCSHYKIDKFSESEELSTSFFLNLMEQESIKELTENIYI